MRAAARLRVERRHGVDHVVERTAEAPFAIRRCDARTMLAATAAAPVGGDELALAIDVGEDATAQIGSIAAMLAWPAPSPATSTMSTTVTVGRGGHLDLATEPTIAVAGARHRSTTRVALAPGATCRIVEEFALGRTGEAPGTIETSLRVTRAGAPLLHHDEVLGAGSPAGTTSVGAGPARHVTTMVVVGPTADDPATLVEPGGAAARLPVAADAVVIVATGVDRPTVAALTDRLAAAPSSALWLDHQTKSVVARNRC